MRTLALAMPLILASLTACVDEITETSCDQYVDYLCTCEPESCDEVSGRFSGGDLALEDQCRIDLACFEQADADNGATCSIVGTAEEDQCLSD